MHHLDVANAFLYGFLEEELYISLPHALTYLDDALAVNVLCDGDESDADNDGEYVYQLLRSLYGLRQAPRVWYEHLKKALHELGLRPLCHAESSFSGTLNGAPIHFVVYVDALLFTTPCHRALATFKRRLQSHFDTRDFKAVASFFNVAIERRSSGYVLSQRRSQ